MDCINPLTGVVFKNIPETDVKDIPTIVSQSKLAQKTWANRSIKERVVYLKKLIRIFIDEQDQICKRVAEDTGKSEYEALIGEYVLSLGNLKFIAKHATSALKPERIRHKIFKNKKSYIQYDPLGVVAVITPWNYPLILSIVPIISALIAGNSVVFKPSEHTSATGELLDDLIKKAGFPNELLQTVYGAGEIGAAVVNEPINKINFTGSLKTGKILGKIAAEKMIPIGLELGGKDPFIVLSDADLDRAAACAIWASNFNGGQTCAACERVIVVKDVADVFITKLKQELDKLSFAPEREVAPLNNQQQYNIVTSQLEDAKHHAKEVYSKPLPEGLEGLYNVAPSLVIEPNENASIYANETFGPLLTIEIASDETEAIMLANKLDFGLTASLWTKSTKKAKYLSKKIEAGSVYINDHLAPQSPAEAPWGGIKSSGIGVTRSIAGLREMCHMKHVSYERIGLKRDLYWFPYSQKKHRFFTKIIRFLA